MLSIIACFRPWIKCNCKVLQYSFSFIPDLHQLLQSIFRLEFNVSHKVSWGLDAVFYEWTESYPPSMKVYEVYMPWPCHDFRRRDIQFYLMGPFTWCHLFANFVGVILFCFLQKNIVAVFIVCHVLWVIVSSPVIK